MKVDKFIDQIEYLTGSSVKFPLHKDEEKKERDFLQTAVEDNMRMLDYSQFNELLLLCNKDRVSEDFFNHFFLFGNENETIALSDISKGVERFRKQAMLAFGNFKYAYRKLSRAKISEIEKELKGYIKKPEEIEEKLKKRPPKIQEIKPIPSKYTYMTGYLSARQINSDYNVASWLLKEVQTFDTIDSLELLKSKARKIPKDDPKKKVVRDKILEIIEKYEKHCKKGIQYFKPFVLESCQEINNLKTKRDKFVSTATNNDHIYLTWDYMDVYLATSMRKNWEFEEVCEFVEKVFENDYLKKLNIRYYNPIQGYEVSDVDKGIVEGLMLKRACCTMYLMQEGDTLGKDSELASTLAQGKPVIVYLKEITDLAKRSEEIQKMPLDFFVDRYKLLYDLFRSPKVKGKYRETCSESESQKDPEKLADSFINIINEQINKKVWDSIETEWAKDGDFKKENEESFIKFCNLIAIAEQIFYNGRADTLKNQHPLRLQVNLNIGVANGVLVVRSFEESVELIKKIVTNKLYYDLDSFKLDRSEDNRAWVLQEKTSECIHRIVTDNVKITNSFWNFYLTE